jgi:hypothetical protein
MQAVFDAEFDRKSTVDRGSGKSAAKERHVALPIQTLSAKKTVPARG